jgi:hypothetical protein
MKKLLGLCFLLWALTHNRSLLSKDLPQSIGIFYYKELYGHLHPHPNEKSPSLKTIKCGQALMALHHKKFNDPKWQMVQLGKINGHVPKHFLSEARPRCLNRKYPQFFDRLHLELQDTYYWGKLYEKYKIDRTKAQ